MNHTLRIRYILFTLLFILVAVGLAVHSYTLLVILAASGVVLAVIGDRIENRPTDNYKQFNELHHRPKH